MRTRPFPPLLINIVHAALQVCDGVRFHSGSTCAFCGGTLSGYDERRKRFAILIEDDVSHPVQVIIQRSFCRECGKTAPPMEPFYPGTRIGSPVVDLCRSLSAAMPYSRVSSNLLRMGVLVDRWSVRHYARAPLPVFPVIDVFGMPIPVSIVSLSSLAGTMRELGSLDMEDVLTACRYPSMIRFPPAQPAHEDKNNSS